MRIPVDERHLISGVEWWSHKRPFGDDTAAIGTVEKRSYNRAYYQYHHFHFDLDDVVLDNTGEWVHPVSNACCTALKHYIELSLSLSLSLSLVAVDDVMTAVTRSTARSST